MNVKTILNELNQERNRLDKAIAALEALNDVALESGKPKSGTSFEFGANISKVRRGDRKMSAAAKRKISQGMKQRWAARRKASQ